MLLQQVAETRHILRDHDVSRALGVGAAPHEHVAQQLRLAVDVLHRAVQLLLRLLALDDLARVVQHRARNTALLGIHLAILRVAFAGVILSVSRTLSVSRILSRITARVQVVEAHVQLLLELPNF